MSANWFLFCIGMLAVYGVWELSQAVSQLKEIKDTLKAINDRLDDQLCVHSVIGLLTEIRNDARR
jgi:hypothetical protein